MSQSETSSVENPVPAPHRESVAFSNAVRLGGRAWVGVVLFGTAVVLLAPAAWELAENFDPGPDFRMPDSLKTDYWLYNRWTRLAGTRADVLVLGDSVVWGLYVPPEETLVHYLSVQSATRRFANLGMNGLHPVALVGLLEHYAAGVAGKDVLLQCNPLWLTSAEQDLQDKDLPREIFHPQLLPQFTPSIPRYRAEGVAVSTRLGIVVGRQVPFLSWQQHLQLAYFGQQSIPGWTLEHPDDNPIGPLTQGLTLPADQLPPRQALAPANFPWVALETSWQWRSFRRAVQFLRQRGNRVFVLLGPFNEHVMTPASRARYQGVKQTIENWLQEMQVPYLAPAVLPREWYGDASHPLAAGYCRLAEQLADEALFPK